MLRDARFFEVHDAGDTIVAAFEDKRQLVPEPLKMFLVKEPRLEPRKWITKDLHGLDTLIELSDITRVDDSEPGWFKPAPFVLERLH